jgi:hypothetical protein
MLHYTLNTADFFDCSRKRFDKNAIARLAPIAQRARAEGQTQTQLPAPLNDWSAKVTVDQGCALFDIYQGDQLVNTNAVAWTAEGQDMVWPLFESTYLQLSGQMATLTVSRAPAMPQSLPWLATLVLPSPAAIGANWLADFEQCLSIALVEADRPKRSRPKGFG